jgi:hypothetical protein
MAERTLSEMIAPQVSESDATMVDVFGLKSKASDDMAGIHTTLAGLGMIPAVGNIADAVDTILYLAEGDTGSAGLSALSMIPFAGLAAGGIKAVKSGAKAIKGGAKETQKLYRGIDEWHRGKMVKEGKFVSPEKMYGQADEIANPSKTGIWATPDRKQALSYIEDDFLENPQLLEFEVPKKWIDEKDTKTILESLGDADWVEGGIPKKYFKKRHKLKQGWSSEYFPPFEDMDW